MIVITGATGRLGSQVVEHLLDRVPASDIGVSVRDPRKAADLAARGIQVRGADFTKPETLDHAFEGAEQVLVVSAGIPRRDEAIAANTAAVDAAWRAGSSRVFYTSHQAASENSAFSPAVVHAAAERHLEASGRDFTALRHGYYVSAVAQYVVGIGETGCIRLPADGPVTWTAHADLAEAAAVMLSGERVLKGVTPTLAGPEALDFADIAEIAGDVLGRRIERIVVDDDDWKAATVANGTPPGIAEFLLGMFRAARAGEFNATETALGQVLGRTPTPAHKVIETFFT